MVKVLEWDNGIVRYLDQTLLPSAEVLCVASDEAAVAEAIKRLAIRGAPLIGIAAAYGIALAALDQSRIDPRSIRARLSSAHSSLASSRPTAVNLFWALERMRTVAEVEAHRPPVDLAHRLLREAQAIHAEDAECCERIAAAGQSFLKPGAVVLTHCNTGALATGGRGTALGIITLGWELGIVRHVFVDETRPLLQGARLTAWELQQGGIPHTLIHDSAAAAVMRREQIDAVIVGADRIAADGDTANKIGTFPLALAATYLRVPVLVAAPFSTVDLACPNGDSIPIEFRSEDEVTMFGGNRTAPEGTSALAPAFDVTPADLISAIITDRGIVHPPYSLSLAAIGEPER